MSNNSKIYEMVTNNIIAQLESGIIPWEKPWTGVRTGAFNLITKKPYSLLNQFMLLKPGEYATYKQWQELGGQVRKGEKASFVVFWKIYKKELDEVDEDGNKKIQIIPVLRYYNVFHIDQVDGVEPLPPEELKEQDPIQAGEDILQNYWTRENINVEITKSNRAYFAPLRDKIVLPLREQFTDIAEFYSTAFHESTHSTGIKSRLDRGLGQNLAAFGSEDYSKEELVAELGAAMLMNISGIENTHSSRNSAGYIQGWLSALKNDKSLIVTAATKAQKAVDFILGENQPTGTDDDDNTKEAGKASEDVSVESKNVIPRSAKMMRAHFTDSRSDFLVYRDPDVGGWHGIDGNGKIYYVSADHLRTKALCELNVIDGDEVVGITEMRECDGTTIYMLVKHGDGTYSYDPTWDVFDEDYACRIGRQSMIDMLHYLIKCAKDAIYSADQTNHNVQELQRMISILDAVPVPGQMELSLA